MTESQSLAADNLGLVAHIVDRHRGRLDRPEALSVGNLALVEAADRWRPGGMPFAGYACMLIRWALIRASKNPDTEALSEEPAFPVNEPADLTAIMERLPPFDAELLSRRFGLGGKPATLPRLSWQFGLSEPTIAKRIQRALVAAREMAEA